MTRHSVEPEAESLVLYAELFRLITSNWKTQAILAAADLKLADLLADGLSRPDALAKATGCQAPSLRRLA